MPISKLVRCPCDLEPSTRKLLDDACDTHNIPRTRLIRILVKYGLENLEKALKRGDIVKVKK